MKFKITLLALIFIFGLVAGKALALDADKTASVVTTKAASGSDKAIARYTALKARYQKQLDQVNSKLDALQANPSTNVKMIDQLKAKKASLETKLQKYQALIDKMKASSSTTQSAVDQNVSKAKGQLGNLGK